LELGPQEVLLWNTIDNTDGVELRAAVPDEAMSALTFGGNPANTSGKTWVDRTTNCQLTVTSHRIVFAAGGGVNNNSNNNNTRYLHMSNLIAETQFEKATMFRSPRLVLCTALGELLLIFRGDKAAHNCREMMSHLETAVRRKEWEKETRMLKQEQAVASSTSRKVGVDAIISRSAARHEQATRITTQAFGGDAENLLEEATALVKIIQRYVATVDKHETTTSSDGNGDDKDNERLTNMLSNMGMTAALRKADYKGREDAYYGTLARQLADFLRPKLKNTMMTLTDVYCVYNRARGTNLISPEDLLQAVDQMEKIGGGGLGLSHYQFPSGLRVLQDAALNQERMEDRLVEIAAADSSTSSSGGSGGGGITCQEASHILHLSVLLAQEQLTAAERHGALVRDETTESIRFYPNRFVEWSNNDENK